MDAGKQSDVVDAGRGRKLGVSGGRPCAGCGVIVDWRVEKFCLARRPHFGGRIYCLSCQSAIPRDG